MTTVMTQQRQSAFSLTPQSIDEALRFAEMLSKSSIVPKDYQGNAGNILVAIQWGMEIGLQPLQAMQNIAVINGRPSIWGDAMLAIVRGSALLEYIREEPTDEGCTCTIKRKGEDPVTRTFTMADAKKAGLANKQGPWTNYPKRMMQMRARAYALRDVFPDVLRGVEIAEEVRDMPAPEKDMGPADVVDGPKATTKTETLKNRIAAKKTTRETVMLQDVIAAIGSAGTLDELKIKAGMAVCLTDPDDKEQARKAYAEKKAALKAESVDPDTGEITQDEKTPASIPLTFAKVADQINKAKTLDDLDLAADDIRRVSGEKFQEELRAMYESAKARLS
jgi:hypothetical protein